MKRRKRILSIALSLAVALSMIPMIGLTAIEFLTNVIVPIGDRLISFRKVAGLEKKS